MTHPSITETTKQIVITRLATINSAVSILSLINGRPAQVTVDEVLGLAEHIEGWVWRKLLGEKTDTRAPEKPAHLSPPAQPAKVEPEPAARKESERPPPNGQGQRWGEVSEKQIGAIFAIGRDKGLSNDELKAQIWEKFGKSLPQLTSREASSVIDELKGL